MADKPLTQKAIEKLLAQQTAIILNAVDKRLEKTELRINQKFNRLTVIPDKLI